MQHSTAVAIVSTQEKLLSEENKEWELSPLEIINSFLEIVLLEKDEKCTFPLKMKQSVAIISALVEYRKSAPFSECLQTTHNAIYSKNQWKTFSTGVYFQAKHPCTLPFTLTL